MSRTSSILVLFLVIAAAVALTYGFKYVSLSSQWRDLQQGAEEQEQALGAAGQELESVKTDLAASRQAVKELSAELGSARAELASAKDGLTTSQRTEERLSSELTSVKGELASAQEALAARVKAETELAAELEEKRLASEQLSAERALLKRALGLFRARELDTLARLRDVEQGAETRVARLVVERNRLAQALRESEGLVQGLLEERREELRMHEFAREELSRTLDVLGELRDNTEIVRTEVIWLGQEISRGLAEREKLVAAAEEADRYLRKWADDFARMAKQYAQLLAGVERMKEERDRFARAMREREERLKELVGVEREGVSERERARREIELTVAILEELKKSFLALRDEVLAMEARFAQSLAEKRELVGIVEEARTSLRRWAQEFERIGERYEDVRAQAYRSEQERARLAEALATCEDRIGVLEAAREQLEASEEEARRLLAERAEDIRRSDQERKDLALLVQKLEESAQESTEELRKLKQAYEELVGKLTRELAQRDVEIVEMRDRVTVRVLDTVLFDLGSTKIKPEGEKVLDRLLPILKQVERGLIVVEGHTDNVPIRREYRRLFPTNWELSTARATRVIRHLQDGGVDPGRMAAVGYSYYRPILSQESEEGRRRNRRIEIVVYPHPPERVPGGM